MSLINKSKQYKTVIDDWKYILRFNDTNKTISRTAKDILFSALYQIEKYGQAIFTHESLELITDVKRHQNLRLLKQLGYVFDWNFSRRLVVKDKKYNDAYQITLKKNAEEILQNPKKYFANFRKRSEQKCTEVAKKDWSKNALTSEQKCSDIGAKKLQCHDSLHIYNKNKDKINNKINYLDNLPFNSIEKSVETAECKIANSKCAEKSHNGLAREECVHNTQAKISAKEDVKAYAPKQQKTPLANQTPSNSEQDIGDYHPMLLKNFPLTDRVIDEVLGICNKPNYTIGKVRLIVRNILDNSPNKPVYGGKTGLVKYLVQAVNNHVEYDNSDYTTNIFQKKHLTAEEQQIVDESWTKNEIRWAPC